MKRRLTLLAIALGFLTGTSGSVVDAQQAPATIMDDAHVQRIQQNCLNAQRTMQQVFVSDGLLRVDRGQAYESLSSKLMAPLNSRLTLAKLDASPLVKTTAQYDKTFATFQSDYKSYYDQMTTTLGIDCVRQPVAFYDSVTLTRQLRVKVHTDSATLQDLITSYEKSFETFRVQFGSSQPRSTAQ